MRKYSGVIPFLLAAGLEMSPLSDWWLSIAAWSVASIIALGVWGPDLLHYATAFQFPWAGQRVSRTRQHGIVLSVHFHWDDAFYRGVPLGRPYVIVGDDGNLLTAWAMLDVEIRNTTSEEKRISDLFMELRTPRIPRRPLAQVEPDAIDSAREWYKRQNRRRVEWLLEPHGPAERHNITFSSDLRHIGKLKHKTFSLAIVAIIDGVEEVRLYLEEDILAATESTQNIEGSQH